VVVFNLIFSENRRWKPNHRFFHNSLILRLFVYLCMYYSFFGFVLLLHVVVILMIMLLCFAAMPYYCHSTLLLAPPCYCRLFSLCLVVVVSSTLQLLWAPPYYCYELHFVVTTSSTLLLLQAPPYCMLYLAVITLPLLLLCLPFYLTALLFNLVASPPLLFLYLLQVPMASPKTLIVALPYCSAFLLFYLAVIACFLCLPD
jgi:hypothetical protein